MTPEIYPYQAKAVGTIFAASKPVLNAFDPGLGKTRVAIASMYARGYKRILVLCPHSVVLVWESEIKKWWPQGPKAIIVRGPIAAGEGIFIVSYGLMSEVSGRMAEYLADTGPFEATILDEAHYLKSPKSNRAERIYELLKQGQLGWVHPMTGTPAPNHAGELWGIVYHLRPDLILSPFSGKPMRESEFMSRYCNIRQFKVNNHWVKQVTGSKNLPELRQRLAPMMLMAKKRDVLPELPPIDFVTLPVQAHIQSHVSSQLGMLELTQDGSDDALLAQLASGVVKSEIQQLGLAKVEAVVEWIEDLLESDDRRRLVVWCVHHAVIDRYAELLVQYKPVTFDGRNNLDQRREAIQSFMTGTARIFIGQIQAGGTGLTLVSKTSPCSDVVFAESSFSPADNFQAACRVHRIGQMDGVLVRHAAAAGTLDDRIQEILARKSCELTELFGVKVLVACEFSGVVRDAFLRHGHDAWSCDLPGVAPEGARLDRHIAGDVLALLTDVWDLMIAHPPCTHLAVSGARWFKGKLREQEAALDFVRALLAAPIKRIAVENPVSVISSRIRKPDQIIQPWMFGHGEVKATCLWLIGLPKLVPTKVVSGRTPRVHFASPGPDRWKERSRTLPGVADAMADQWGWQI